MTSQPSRVQLELDYAIDTSHSNLARLLFDDTANAPLRNLTPMMIAAAQGNLSELLVHKKADLRQQTDQGLTALMLAAIFGHAKCAGELLEEATMQDANGRTALMFAAQHMHADIITMLADTELGFRDQYGRTALMAATIQNYLDGVDLLLDECRIQDMTGVTALMLAAENDHHRLTRRLAEYETGLTTTSGVTALMLAVTYGRRLPARILALTEAGMQCSLGWTALMIAANSGNSELIELLVDEEGGRATNHGLTALMNATARRNIPSMRLLIDHEAGMQTETGMTAMMQAAQNGYLEGVRELVQFELGIRDSMGRTALDLARECGQDEIVSFLEGIEGDDVNREAMLMISQRISESRRSSTPGASGVSGPRKSVSSNPPTSPKPSRPLSGSQSHVTLSQLCESGTHTPIGIGGRSTWTPPYRQGSPVPVIPTLPYQQPNQSQLEAYALTVRETHERFRTAVRTNMALTTSIAKQFDELRALCPTAIPDINKIHRRIGRQMSFTSVLVDFAAEVLSLADKSEIFTYDNSGSPEEFNDERQGLISGLNGAVQRFLDALATDSDTSLSNTLSHTQDTSARALRRSNSWAAALMHNVSSLKTSLVQILNGSKSKPMSLTQEAEEAFCAKCGTSIPLSTEPFCLACRRSVVL
ncbi:Ankyrin repeat protein 1 [Giardia muris]|uniref:Ankyrin repeat protein 1 n=1 Tax=Giardia muris TaxID=5742 RepID=A0A4Z1SLJ5_GIAMU|nr:Ankyrin repeat protein 1 [Giardia muris]|eukprot:TNJ26522.1 Ankyrin repeat protein 1 [Giardia muris]